MRVTVSKYPDQNYFVNFRIICAYIVCLPLFYHIMQIIEATNSFVVNMLYQTAFCRFNHRKEKLHENWHKALQINI